MEYQGAVFDILGNAMIDRSPIIRWTRDEAMQDARELCAQHEGFDPDTDAYVIVNGQLEY